MKKILLISLLLMGCDHLAKDLDCLDGCTSYEVPKDTIIEVQGPETIIEVPGPERIVEVPATVVKSEVELMVDAENEYRIAQGNIPLAKGLTCSVYDVSNSTPSSIQTAGLGSVKAKFTLLTEFNQSESSVNEGLNIFPEPLRNIYKTWYVVRCTGYLVVLKSDYYSFELTSDDGSRLYLDNSLTVNHDGNHSSSTKYGYKLLQKGIRQFKLEYMQATGQQSLVLKSGGALVNSNYFYR